MESETTTSPTPAYDKRLLALGIAVFLAIFWSQALQAPYWQDDYYYLLDAQQARFAGEPWHAAFFPEVKVNFWRPLGMETYWRFVEGVLGGDVLAAHILNILLLLAAAAAVGWFAGSLVGLLAPGRSGMLAGLLAMLLYGVHSAHFLPAAWAAAANNSIAVLFSALALRFWLLVSTVPGRRAHPAVPLVVLCFGLALLSRDIAIVIPALALLLNFWLWPRFRPTATTWTAGGGCLLLALGWLLLRSHFTLAPHPAYEMNFGLNALRNAGALLLFAFNVPFEALRFYFFVQPSVRIAVWGLLPFLLQAAAFGLLLRASRHLLGGRGLLVLGGFFVAGCGPAFFFSVNCYPYYITLGLVSYAVVAGLAAERSRWVPVVLLLAVLSSSIATLGNFFLDSPSHIGRARWAERQLVRLEMMQGVQPELFIPPLVLAVEDEHRYLGFRAEGIAWRLGIALSDVEVREPAETVFLQRPVLVVPREGDVYFRTAGEGT